MQIPEGTIVDKRFRIGWPLGAGATGAVYEAMQLDLERPVAIKFLKDSAICDAEEVARFHREAQVLCALKHRNIVNVYAFGHWGGAYYMVIERVEGKSLDELLEPKKPLARELVFDTIAQVCDGLAAAHAHDIVHRDIKPSNIIIASNGDVKIIDFGFAKIVGPSSQQFQQLTEAGTAIGTVLYMSPEQCNAEAVDHRSDIYSTGAMLYHCLTGHAPFMAGDYLAVMRMQLNAPVPRLGAQFSESLQNVVDNSMAKKRGERYQSIKDMQEDLARAKDDQPVALRTMTSPVPVLKEAAKDQKKTVAIAIVASFVLSVAMLFYFARHPGQMHSVAEERSDMVSLLETQHTRLMNQISEEKDKRRKGELLVESAETLIRLADISDLDRKKYIHEAEQQMNDALAHTDPLEQPAFVERLENAFKSEQETAFRHALLARVLEGTDARRKKKTTAAREVYSRVLNLVQDDKQNDATRFLQVLSINGILGCDKLLDNRAQWKEDVDRCVPVALRMETPTSLSVVQVVGVLNSVAVLDPKFAGDELALAKKADRALRDGGEMDKDFHQLTLGYVYAAGGYVRNKQYKPALELMKIGRPFVAKSRDKADALMYNKAIKEWAFQIAPI